jgi:hypothetical protein
VSEGVVDWLTIASKYFLEPNLTYALLLLIPFFLLYLIRPKPRQKVMPSLMFLFKDMGRDRKMQFFRKLIQNLLFIFQLLILLFLLTSAAKPFIDVTKESLFKNTVLVLDASASMKSDYKGGTRLDEAVSLAKKNLGSINTVILVKKTPEVVLVEEDIGKVRDYLSKLKPTDTPTNLYEAISTAGGYAKSDSRVVVISDFIDTETDTDLDTAKKTLEAQGIKVDFIRVFEPVKNIGIVDLIIDNEKTSAVVKNYNAGNVSVKIKVNTLEETMGIPPNSQELFTFSTPPGTSKVEIEANGMKDGFAVDDVAFISTPSDTKKKVIIITNNLNYQKTYLYNAFSVMKNVAVDVAIPPKIPDLSNYDVFVLKDIDPNLILPGTFAGIKKEVEEKGKAAILLAQSNPTLLSIDFHGLLPMWTNETLTSTGTNIIAGSTESITANIEFGVTKKYFRMNLEPEKPVVVLAGTDDDNPIVTFNNLGSGKIFFYGILDEDKQADTGFAKSPVFFVFWKRIIDFATNTPSIKNLNYLTGSTLSFSKEERIQTPEGRITAKSLSLDYEGLYTLNDRTIAISLINDQESDVSKAGTIDEKGISQSSDKFKDKVPYELTDYLIVLAILVLFMEFIYIKMRGDL